LRSSTPTPDVLDDSGPGHGTITDAPFRAATSRAGPGASGVRRRTKIWTIRAVILLALLATWQWYGSRTGGIFVPSLTQTLAQFPDLLSSGVLTEALWRSNVSLVIGYPISVVAGMAIGFLIARKRTADRALSYWLDIAMVVPMIAIVPVIIVALGLTLTARVAAVILFALPVIALNSRAAVRVIDQDLVEMSRSFGATTTQTWTAVILPAALAPIFTGLRIGLGRGISGMIVVELTLVPAGLGGLLLDYKSSFSGASLYATTLVVLCEGVLLTGLGHSLERRLAARMQGAAL
jgi:ABC-type nitrate/sulfonate/bicarbonate transport system permease component